MTFGHEVQIKDNYSMLWYSGKDDILWSLSPVIIVN